MKFLVVHLDLDSLSYPTFLGLAHKTGIIQLMSASLVRGLVDVVTYVPHINYPLLVVCLFSM